MSRTLVFGLALAVLVLAGTAGARTTADCSRATTGLVPLNELKSKRYAGAQGGLYPNGKNAPNARYAKLGLQAARRVRGRVVLLSVGMSNTTQEFRSFVELARSEPGLNPQLHLVDGAQGGQDAVAIADPAAPYWRRVDQRLRAAGVTRADVQVVWLKQAIARPTEAFPADAKRLQARLRTIVGILRTRFRSLKLVYVSSRVYAGYATTALNPEPYAYQSGFAVKWLVADRIAGRLKGPWVAWGPYLWADGATRRSDGLRWTCDDFAPDGTHPSEPGRAKVAERLLRFLKTSPTSKPWFLAPR